MSSPTIAGTLPPGARGASGTESPGTFDAQRYGAWADKPGIIGWLSTVDHKRVGRRFIATGFAFFVLGGILARLMRVQLARPESTLIGPDLLQPAFHDARHDDDVPVRRADDAGDGRLFRAADDRRAQHRVPADERICVLGLPVRRGHAVRRAFC